MISMSGLSASLALRLIGKTEDKEHEMIESEPQHAREIAYFMENIENVETVDDLIGDYRLYSFVMKAYDLEDQIFGKAMMGKILKSDIEEDDALVNKLTDDRFEVFYEAMGFTDGGTSNSNTIDPEWKAKIVDAYVDTTYVNAKADDNEALGLALQFRRKAATVESAYDLLKDEDMAQFIRTALGLPDEIASGDIDRQAALLAERVDIDRLGDEDYVESLVSKFAAISDANSDTVSTNSVVTLVSSAMSASSGSFVPVTIDIDTIQGFSGYKLR
ncbi:DUF1217 domain-containing protein [Alloyangia pacifica]|uniref:DUF1217 domain-containing protein n=1 Tax=Alloyangia pacifica TaxID=311180 RepID=A0A1I6SZY6_9RHOB|nr:DUF1217 domain-containing protein [Alloyangia pacifica]SDG92599.1 Protein of unknown function [Alloyangia pacifica]SFS82420.1 Protein of unknown function [Alloyangia pacifica]